MSNTNLTERYQKVTQLEHILKLPDTYIGSIEKSPISHWIFDQNVEQMKMKKINIANGLYKIFDEILVNACDQHQRLKTEGVFNQVTKIDVEINKSEEYISVMNNGESIDVQIHPQHGVYIPQMIFGELLTSTNYNEKKIKTVGGKNGYGAKLTNIYSKKFIVELVDHKSKNKYVQVFEDNMTKTGAPKITKNSGKPYTKITFYPDLKRFNMNELEDDIINIMTKRVYDLSACTDHTLTVTLNGKKILQKQFDTYVNLYLGKNKTENPRIYDKPNDRWEVVVCLSPDEEFRHVSFVNGIYTYQGGKHVDHVRSVIAKKLQTWAKKKKKTTIKLEYLKKNMWVFVKCLIDNPSFSSQTKEFMTTPVSKFGQYDNSKFNIDDKVIDKIGSKLQIVERSILLSKHKDEIGTIVKNEYKTRKHLKIPKLEEANWAGHKDKDKRRQCTLILTEGDSAKATAMSGLSVVGRDRYGVFPLKGKPLNVREATVKQLITNEEINNIKKIMGLKEYERNGVRKVYKNVDDLRYGSIMLLVDQDYDGAHIKGLLMNFIHYFWKDLCSIKGFVTSLATPIIKATKGNQKKIFYTMKDYENWKNKGTNKGWKIKYYKGLGTSNREEAKEYFKDLDANKINYCTTGDECHEAVLLAFDKKMADKRKEWLLKYDSNKIIEQKEKHIDYNDFINRELIHFSNYDLHRSVPCLCDGLKPSQRKILYSAFKRNLKSEIKVAQFAGYISENSGYHHGENSLHEAIVGMAQDYVGSNNINLLYPSGQFGTRLEKKDHASPRYIYTRLNNITDYIYNKLDKPILNYLDDDGYPIEPQFYLPIIPMVLVNGCEGIGTGFSTKIPAYNPLDIVQNVRLILDGKTPKNMIPWYRGFKGKIWVEEDNYKCYGKYEFVNDTILRITELPIGVWTTPYKSKLDDMIIDKSETDPKKKKKQCIQGYSCGKNDNDISVDIIIKMSKTQLTYYKKNTERLEKDFGLTKNINVSNMHLYNDKGEIVKYHNVNDIIRDYYKVRLHYYAKRRTYWLAHLKHELDIITQKVKFIRAVRSSPNSDDYVDIKMEIDDVNERLEELGFIKFDLNEKIEIDGDGNIVESNKDNYSYEYLLKMPIRTLTITMLKKLETQYEEKQAEYDELFAKTPKTLWRDDLTVFLKEYKKQFKNEIVEDKPVVTKKKIIKKKA